MDCSTSNAAFKNLTSHTLNSAQVKTNTSNQSHQSNLPQQRSDFSMNMKALDMNLGGGEQQQLLLDGNLQNFHHAQQAQQPAWARDFARGEQVVGQGWSSQFNASPVTQQHQYLDPPTATTSAASQLQYHDRSGPMFDRPGFQMLHRNAQFANHHQTMQPIHGPSAVAAQEPSNDDWTQTFVEEKNRARAEELQRLPVPAEAAITQKEDERSTDISPDALARTAKLLSDLISENPNPKFQNSQFLKLMNGFRDGELGIEGDKVVEKIAAAERVADQLGREGLMGYQNEGYIPAANTTTTTTGMESVEQLKRQFMENEAKDMSDQPYSSSIGDQPFPSSFQLAQEFRNTQMGPSDWQEQMDLSASSDRTTNLMGPPRNWAREFVEQQESEITPVFKTPMFTSSDVSHDMDLDDGMNTSWANAFKSTLAPLEPVVDDDLMARQFESGLEINDEASTRTDLERQWKEMANEYAIPSREEPAVADVLGYTFCKNNPFVHMRPEALVRQMHTPSSNLTERILTLEATVQTHPENQDAWYQLGLIQQENENEDQAIIALERCIALDGTTGSCRDAFLSLAVSYTNENQTLKAQSALGQWLLSHPQYGGLAGMEASLRGMEEQSSTELHEKLIRWFIAAAQVQHQTAGMAIDPQVQSSLGILFNINHDYPKAIECFQTALSVSPDDYLLWNKLGATLANSGKSDEAIDAYYRALEIRSGYIRVRYNLGIACMQIGQYQEAAGYLLAALAIQEKSMHQVLMNTTPDLMPEVRLLNSGQSEGVWSTLRLLLSSYIRRNDLVSACDAKDLSAFKADFDF